MQKMAWLLNRDKLMHMLAGIVMIDIFVPICASFLCNWLSIAIPFAIATVIMALKEIVYDKILNRGVCSWKDFIAGEIAIVFLTVIFIILFTIMT